MTLPESRQLDFDEIPVIDMSLVTGLREAASEFFNLPEPARRSLGLDPSMRGFLPLFYHSQISDSFSGTSHQEGFWIGAEFGSDIRNPLEQVNRWPQHPERLRPIMLEYLEAVEIDGFARETGTERQLRAINGQRLKREPPHAILGKHELRGGKQNGEVSAAFSLVAQSLDMRERLVLADQGGDAVFIFHQQPGPVFAAVDAA